MAKGRALGGMLALSDIFKISILSLIVITAISMFEFILPFFIEEFETSMLVIGFSVSLLYLASFFVEVPIGLLVDRFGRKIILLVCIGLMSIMGLIYFFVEDINSH